LRNPLAPIRNAVQVLKAAGGDNTTVVRASDIINRQVTHLAGLIDDLLDVARIGRGKLAVRMQRVDLKEIVQQAVETCRPLLAAVHHELVVTLCEEPCAVMGDFTRLAQVVSNLVGNAAKFTAPGGRIEVFLTNDGTDAVLRVRDNGRGMDPATIANVFDLFYQGAHESERAGTGLGIGLALVKSLVALHGGRVEAVSEGRGLGSEFIVSLPCASEDDLTDKAAPPATSRPLRVLVVDDNRDAADSTALLLELQGHVASVAYDGEEAVGRAIAMRPDAVLLDIALPKMHGHDVCRALRAAGLADTFIVAVTGYDDADTRHRSTAAGFDAIHVKPLGNDVIARLLKPLVARKAPRRDLPHTKASGERPAADAG
jgi:CheY-like chemotaxis protein/two-component sensor histidine kinase